MVLPSVHFRLCQQYRLPWLALLWICMSELRLIDLTKAGGLTAYQYPNTTWPGFTTFTYSYAEMHGRHQPAWDFYSDPVGYIARLQYIFQSGIPKLDLAFYQKLTTYPQTPRSYIPTDLEEDGMF